VDVDPSLNQVLLCPVKLLAAPSPRVLSINAGARRTLQVGARQQQTGLFKEPLGGPVLIDAQGVPGDEIINRRYHGGPDQALYLYSQVDMGLVGQRNAARHRAGFFGENLTISPLVAGGARGGSLQVGDLLLEITRRACPVRYWRRG